LVEKEKAQGTGRKAIKDRERKTILNCELLKNSYQLAVVSK